MLVLSREAGEAIVIDGAVRVTVMEVHGGRVRLGVQAPAQVPVVRTEVRARRDSVVAALSYDAFGAAVDASEFSAEAELTRY